MTNKTNVMPAAVAKNAYKSRRVADIAIDKKIDANGVIVDATTKSPSKRDAKSPAKRDAKTKSPATSKTPATKNVITSADIAATHNMNVKTLRARIRRNIEQWQSLFVNGERHKFADDAATRKSIAALLDA